MPDQEAICDRCHRLIEVHGSYVVKIEVFAEPTVPEVSGEDLRETDYAQQIRDLIASMKDASPRELQEGVYRRFDFRLCPSCQRQYLENPLPND